MVGFLKFVFTLITLCLIVNGHTRRHNRFERFNDFGSRSHAGRHRPQQWIIATDSAESDSDTDEDVDSAEWDHSDTGEDDDSAEWDYRFGWHNDWEKPRYHKTTKAPIITTLRTTSPRDKRPTTSPKSKIKPSLTSRPDSANARTSPRPDPQPSSTTTLRIDACLKSCPVTSEYNPLCGTNNVTYTNLRCFECARRCGLDIEVRARSTCTVADDNTKTNIGVATTISPPTSTTPKETITTPSLLTIMACMQTCSITTEFNPVCGTDGVTYTNPGRLLCAQFCGIEVFMRKMSACDALQPNDNGNVAFSSTTATPLSSDAGSLSPVVQACINACPSGSENNPVCGTDNVTYINIGRLMCVKSCGVDVSLQGMSACPNADKNDNTSPPMTTPSPSTGNINGGTTACLSLCPITSEYNPVCGTNNVTYNNMGSLNCARGCGINVELQRLSQCSVNNNEKEVITMPGNKDEPTEATGATGSKIPKDILDMIFNTTPTPLPTTMPGESGEFQIDPRFKPE